MAKKNRISTDPITDCACVIHGEAYSWEYVEKLYNMLSRHLPAGIRMHVYTEPHRPVPAHMIKHELLEWPGISGPKRSWWYKMQLFDNSHFTGAMYWDTAKFGWVWDKFTEEDINKVVTRWPGDQDYINQIISPNQRRYFADYHCQSFRWQALDGGMNFRARKANSPGGGVKLAPDASVLVFHGKPKPHEVSNPHIQQLWQ